MIHRDLNLCRMSSRSEGSTSARGFHRMIPKPAASVSPRNLLETQSFEHNPDLLYHKLWKWSPEINALLSPPDGSLRTTGIGQVN